MGTITAAARALVIASCVIAAVGCACGERDADQAADPGSLPRHRYQLLRVFEVAGRQGIATDGERYYVSGSSSLHVYSKTGELLFENLEPFAALDRPANHIGDIDIHRGELYAGIEWFDDGEGRDIQVAVYDASTLEYRRSIGWSPDSGQVEVSGVAVDPDNGAVWMTDWVNGRYLYRYDLETGGYQGRLHLRPVPQGQQGIAWHDGQLYLTADDGDADQGEADNLWRVPAEVADTAAYVTLERLFDDFRLAGEIEGLGFDPEAPELAVLANRGARIVLGMPRGFYPGYDREVHEVYVYRIEAGE